MELQYIILISVILIMGFSLAMYIKNLVYTSTFQALHDYYSPENEYEDEELSKIPLDKNFFKNVKKLEEKRKKS